MKAKAMVAVKVVVTVNVTVVEDKSNAAIRALTTVVTAKAVPRRVAHALKAEAQVAAHKVGKVDKTAAVTMATNCHATLIH